MDYTKLVAKLVVGKTTTELARRKSQEFMHYTKPDFQQGRHHGFFFDIADDILYGRRKRVMLSVPPRHTKSETFSIRLPAHFLGLYPNRRVIHVSHSARLSNKFSRQVRRLLRDDTNYRRLFPKTMLDPDRQRVDDWQTTDGGGMLSLGVGGGVTGEGGDLIILDDVVKEGDENSPEILRDTFDWYASALRTRLQPGGAIIIPMTRWSTQDIIGMLRALAERDPNAEQWHVIELPAIALQNDILGREPGQALWPEWYDVSDLMAIKSLSPRYWEALYQQKPLDEIGKLFERHKFERFILDADDDKAAVWTFDLALGEKESADFSVWGRWMYKQDEDEDEYGELYVESIHRNHEKWPVVKRQIILLIQTFEDDVFVFPKHTFELMAVQELKDELPDDAYRILAVSMTGDKHERAALYSSRVASRRAFVEEGKAGDDFINEHDMFPGPNDDFVDMSSVAAHYFGLKQEIKIISGYTEDEQKRRRLLKREQAHLQRRAVEERLGDV